MGEELAGSSDTGLHLIEDQKESVLVADLTQALEHPGRNRPHPAFTLDGLDEDAGRGLGDGAKQCLLIAEGNLVETVDLRPEAFEIFGLSAGRDRGERAAMEGALESDDAVTFGMALGRMIFARHLDRAFERFRP